MHRVLEKEGKKVILLGNEAIVRGALEAGVGFASCYPGTPSSEIGDTFSEIAKDVGIYFEYSTNEKVALEAAAGAAFCGVRSIVSFKHFGFNVASDSIFPLAYYGLKGGMVIINADDPGCWSSGQSDQDSRYYARIGHIPLLEPSDPVECKDYTILAFELSEKWGIPVIIRTTTRVSHASAAVELGKLPKPKTKGVFEKGNQWRTMPPKLLSVHEEVHSKLDEILKAYDPKINYVVNEKKSDFGIITASVCYNYVMDVLEELNLKIPVLKIGISYPIPKEKISSFIKGLKKLLVVEEIEPIMENDVRMIAKDVNPQIEIHGKDVLPQTGEIRPEHVVSAISFLTNKSKDVVAKYSPCSLTEVSGLKIPPRTATFCPGCPHRATFWEAKVAGGQNTVFGGDIGCYILGVFPPTEMQDWIISMGAGEGISHGIKKVSDQKVIAFVGDSTFFHAGIPPLINMVYNKSNPLIIALDNRATAMTGHQPHPGTGMTGMHEATKALRIEEIAKACGVENIAKINVWNVKESIAKIKEFLEKPSVSLIVAEGECRLQYVRKARKQGIKLPIASIDTEKCKRCGICIEKFGCPAIHRDDKKYFIDPDICWGCGVCPQICPFKAISMSNPEEKK